MSDIFEHLQIISILKSLGDTHWSSKKPVRISTDFFKINIFKELIPTKLTNFKIILLYSILLRL